MSPSAKRRSFPSRKRDQALHGGARSSARRGGSLRLDDALDTYFAGTAGAERVRIRHLLSHTSGIPNDLDDPAVTAAPGREWDHDQLVESQLEKGLLFDPGSQYMYSNTNFIALGRIIERVTGSTYSAALARRILRPLHLRSTSLDGEQSRLPPHVPGVRTTNGSFVEVQSPYHPSLTWAAGGLISTADDLLRFMEGLFGGRLLSRASLAAMIAPTVLDDGSTSSYGFGIASVDTPLGRAYYHDGNLPPSSSLMGYVPERRLATVIFSATLEAGALSIYSTLEPRLVDVLRR